MGEREEAAAEAEAKAAEAGARAECPHPLCEVAVVADALQALSKAGITTVADCAELAAALRPLPRRRGRRRRHSATFIPTHAPHTRAAAVAGDDAYDNSRAGGGGHARLPAASAAPLRFPIAPLIPPAGRDTPFRGARPVGPPPLLGLVPYATPASGIASCGDYDVGERVGAVLPCVGPRMARGAAVPFVVVAAVLLAAGGASAAKNKGCVVVDPSIFDKVVMGGGRTTLVRFDQEYPSGEKDEEFKKFAESVAVGQEDTGEQAMLRRRFGVKKARLPAFRLFTDGAGVSCGDQAAMLEKAAAEYEKVGKGQNALARYSSQSQIQAAGAGAIDTEKGLLQKLKGANLTDRKKDTIDLPPHCAQRTLCVAARCAGGPPFAAPAASLTLSQGRAGAPCRTPPWAEYSSLEGRRGPHWRSIPSTLQLGVERARP
eukprot:gene32966-65012_t